MTLTQYLVQLPGPLFGKKMVKEVLQVNGLTEFSDLVIKKAEARLQLPFVPETENNLCYIQSQEVLPGFRTSFHDMHLLDVFYACSLNFDSSSIGLDLLPFPTNPDLFWELSEYGRRLRILHTLSFQLPHSAFPFAANSPFEKLISVHSHFPFYQQIPGQETGKIWVNAENYFSQVPSSVWDFKIHQRFPAREALKKHFEISLIPNMILGYQKRLYAVKESLSLVKTIEKLDIGNPIL